MPCAGTIAFVDGSVFKGCMCNDRPIKGILIEDGLEYEVTFSNTCDSLISGFKPRPKTKRVVSKMRKEDTSIEGGGSGEGSSEVMGGASAAVEDAMEELGPIGEEGERNREKVVQEMPVVVQMGVAGVFLTVLGVGEAGKVVVETGGGARKMATRKRR